MWNFDGDARKKRQINLGGQRAQQDKQDLLKKTQFEREMRELERKKQKNSIKIQAVWRGRRLYAQEKDEMRQLWDSEIVGRLENVNPKELNQMIGQFLYFYRPFQDLDRLKGFICVLKDSQTLFSSEIVENDVYQTRLMKLALVVMKMWGMDDGMQKGSVNDFIQFIQHILDAKNWSNLHRQFVNRLLSVNLYTEIRTFLLRYPPETSKSLPSTNVVLLLTLIPLKYPEAIPLFTSQILTIPLLLQRLSTDTLAKMVKAIPLDQILSYLAQDGISGLSQLTVQQFSSQKPRNQLPKPWMDNIQWIGLLGNLVMLGQGRYRANGNLSSDFVHNFTESLEQLLAKIPDRILDQATKQSSVVSYQTLSDEEEVEAMVVSSPTDSIDPANLSFLSQLVSRPFLQTLATSSLSSETPYTSVTRTAKFFTALISRLPNRKPDILMALAYLPAGNDSFLKLLWGAFFYHSLLWGKCGGKMGDYTPPSKQRLPTTLFTDPSLSGEWCVLHLFCELYARILLTMGDDEFFGKNVLTMKDVSLIVGLLRNVAFALHWNPTDDLFSNTTLTTQQLTSSTTRVLQQIHARESRKSFCPEDVWLMTGEMDMDSFVRHAVGEEEMTESTQVYQGWSRLNPQGIANASPNQHRASRERGPRQAVLKNIPFVVPFETRVNVFREFIRQDRQRSGLSDEWMAPVARVTIRRQYVFEDGFSHLNALGPLLKRKIAITFVNEHGMVEAGIDGGGVFKEFLNTLAKQAFDMNYGLFLPTSDQNLYPNPHSYATNEERLRYYEFLGKILGKALYEGILLDVSFADFFLAKWLGRQSYLDDLASLDPTLYQGLLFLKNYNGDVENDLSLSFTVEEEEFGTVRSIDLIPNGSQIPVTAENRIKYIYLVANYKLNTQIARQCRAFFRGLSEIIKPAWLEMFNPRELQILLSGSTANTIDLEDFKNHTVYAGVFDENHPTIKNFWKVVKGMNSENQRNLVRFITSCSRPPLLGFKELNPQLCIRDSGSEQDRLPTASTCVNLLKLPAYTSEKVLKEKLLYAINSASGFELS